MSAFSGELDDNGLLNDGPLSHGPLKHAAEKGRTAAGENPKNAAPEVKTNVQPDQMNPPATPWKRKHRRETFDGNVVELALPPDRLAIAPDRIARPPWPDPAARIWRPVAVTAVVMMAAVGYLWSQAPGKAPSSRAPAPVSERPDLARESFASASNHTPPSPDFQPAEVRPATRGLVPEAAAGGTGELTSRAALVPARPIVATANQPARRADVAEIALMIKQGEQLMANADISGARLVFERAAESGDAAAALALAETYDPLVLAKSGTRGGITPDIVVARSWYEKARELGSTVAPQRILRLAEIGG